MRWQKRARLAIAVFGVAFAAVVYFAIRPREQPVAATAVTRIDPAAIIETSGCVLQSITGTRKNFTVTCDRQLTYANGESKMFGVRVEIKERQGRDFAITGAEAQANEKSRTVKFSGDVKLLSSDGFQLSTATAMFDEREGIVRTPGPVAFEKGRMSGTGVGMTYDQNTDVLTILDRAHVRMVDEGDNTTGEFAAGTATLDRVQNYLALERAVHVLRGEQTIDADRSTARLTEDETAITAIELRGSSRVAGGSSGFDSMSARDIDLGYGADGTTIERVVLTGGGAIVLKGSDGTPGRQIMGESLEIALAADGSVTSVVGRERTQLSLPADSGSAARRVTAKNLDATGEPGKGMTAAQFSEDVEYAEEAGAVATPRTARSQTLHVALDGSAISNAAFRGQVQFEEGKLKASAAEARYEPTKGVLRLKGADQGGGPRVADEQIAIEAAAIDITLEGRRMLATGNVKTRLQSSEKTPGLLKRDQPTNVSAAALRYDGKAGLAVYTGTAQLWQGDTAIRGDSITIDQEKGNLSAIGSARSTLTFGNTPSVGRAEEITYENTTRLVTFTGVKPPLESATIPLQGARPAPKKPAARAAPKVVPAQLSGPEGDLKADRIVVVLHKNESKMERLEGHDNVTLRVDQRLVTGARMTYYAEGRYEMSGTPTVPVKIVESCRETTGRTLTFFKSTDNIVIDGNEEIRTRTSSGGPCPQVQEDGGRR